MAENGRVLQPPGLSFRSPSSGFGVLVFACCSENNTAISGVFVGLKTHLIGRDPIFERAAVALDPAPDGLVSIIGVLVLGPRELNLQGDVRKQSVDWVRQRAETQYAVHCS